VVDHHFQRVPRVENGELESPADLPSAGLPLVTSSLWISKLGNVQVCLLLLLVSQARVEECVDQVRVGDLIGESEDAGDGCWSIPRKRVDHERADRSETC